MGDCDRIVEDFNVNRIVVSIGRYCEVFLGIDNFIGNCDRSLGFIRVIIWLCFLCVLKFGVKFGLEVIE